MKKECKFWFYGIYGIELIWHGNWSDLEIVWHKKSFNYYDLENTLLDNYREMCNEHGIKVNEDFFPAWVQKNPHLAREILQNFLENKCFYGV